MDDRSTPMGRYTGGAQIPFSVQLTDRMVEAKIAGIAAPERLELLRGVDAGRRAFTEALYRPDVLSPARAAHISQAGSVGLQPEAGGETNH